MKLRQLLEGYNPTGSWRSHPTRKGVLYRSRTQHEIETEKRKEAERAKRAANKKTPEDRAKLKAANDQWLLDLADRAISDSFPDGDPIDHMSNQLNRKGLTMDDVDRVIRKREGRGVKGFYDYLAQMWEDSQGDAVHDAKNGHVDVNSVFYTVDKNGKVTPTANPWK